MAKSILLKDLPVIDKHTSRSPDDINFAAGAILPVDKPLEWTSFDVVKYVRNRIPVKKVGHAGTLDPLATGLLVLCCGKATKSISQIQDKPKTYAAEITFGASTSSYDSATDVTETGPVDHLQTKNIEETLKDRFTGEIEQVPPVYSAIKKNGKRFYKLARKGVDVKPDPRPVFIYNVEIIHFDSPKLTLKIQSGKGFYVRSLAYDLGKAMKTCAHLSDLRRTDTGSFSVENAWTVDDFNQWVQHG